MKPYLVTGFRRVTTKDCQLTSQYTPVNYDDVIQVNVPNSVLLVPWKSYYQRIHGWYKSSRASSIDPESEL